MRTYAFLLLLTLTSVFGQIPDTIIRPDVQNAHRPNNDPSTEAVQFVNGDVSRGINTTILSDGTNYLGESSFGQNFVTYESPYGSFAEDVLRNGWSTSGGSVSGVFTQLYPPGYNTATGITMVRGDIVKSDGIERDGVTLPRLAFRYKWLAYGEDPNDTSGTPAILNIFNDSENAATWFTDDDRALAREQIDVLREALAYDPVNRTLQAALLDIYHDWAQAEMLFARKELAALATVRLGLVEIDPGRDSVIDDEITTYKELVRITKGVLLLYGELFSLEMEGFNPTDLFASTIAETGADPTGGAPFGYFIFQNQVPCRQQVATQYATSDGTTEEIPIPGVVIDPCPIGSGFLDYRTLLTVLGQHVHYQAELARLRGMRRATTPDGNDVSVALQDLTEVQEGAATSICLLDNLFSQYDFDDSQFDMTGIRGVKALARSGLNEMLGVRSFLNGTSNMLGLDPNFLLLLPTPSGETGPFDTYDIMASRLLELEGGSPGPLQKALNELGDPNNTTSGGGAIQAYTTFRASVDKVGEELAGLEDDYAARFLEITGHNAETGAWNGFNPITGSDLATVDRSISSLYRQNRTLGEITLQLLEDISKAEEAVTLAEGIDDTITGAKSTYLEATASAWTEIQTWAGVAAGAQAAADMAYEMAGVDGISTAVSGGGTVAAIGAAGAINIGVQTAAAVQTSKREEDIDQAAIAFETKLALAEAPLTVKQAELEVGALLREAYANRLEIEDNFTNLAQGIADKIRLLRELVTLEENLGADRAALSGRFFADPIHFVRAERATFKAHAAFRDAQRWVFFTARALEYKWQQRFAVANPGNPDTPAFDIGSILKARNATELKEIAEQMALFDNGLTPGTPIDPTPVVISLRDHFITPNPEDRNLDFLPALVDDGLRYDPVSRAVLSKEARFRQLLASHTDDFGNIEIPFDTTILENVGGLFAGPNFDDPSNPESGFYRDKIDQIAVNIVASDGPPVGGIDVNGRSGRIIYGGNTFFRTRVPLCPDRDVAGTQTGSEGFREKFDFRGEFVVAPFQFYQDTNFTGVFDVFDRQSVGNMKFSYSSDEAKTSGALRDLLVTDGFVRKDLKERSVAATRWALRLNNGQYSLSTLEDIEVVLWHVAYPRPQITCD